MSEFEPITDPADPGLHGVIAAFNGPGQVLRATRAARKAGYKQMEAYTPFAVEGLAQELDFNISAVPLLTLIGGLLGAAGGFWMLWYARSFSYPLNIGGRPLFSWPAYIPITFELGILGASFAAFFGVLALNGLPRPYHPVFNVHEFEFASQDKFFLCIEAGDPKFDRPGTADFLRSLNPVGVWEVPK
jgi:hypothetical protein